MWIFFFYQALAATLRQLRHSFSRCTTSMATTLSNCRSTDTLTRLCIAVPVTDLPLGATLVNTTSTYQIWQPTSKPPLPSVALPTPFPRDIQLVIVHSLLGGTILPQLILKCFTRQLLKIEVIWHHPHLLCCVVN